MLRLLHLIIGDIKFQFKYGFYTIYFILAIFYVVVLSLLPDGAAKMAGSIFVFSDPAAMGMLFMGAIVLLEKSERVLNSLAVSPVSPEEYIISKIVSIGIVSTIVGLAIVISKASACGLPLLGDAKNLVITAGALFLSSTLFTLCGLLVGAKARSLNQYILLTLPIEIIGFLPPIIYLFGYGRENLWLRLHPGCAMILLIHQEMQNSILSFGIALVWIFLLFVVTRRVIARMFQSVGGISL